MALRDELVLESHRKVSNVTWNVASETLEKESIFGLLLPLLVALTALKLSTLQLFLWHWGEKEGQELLTISPLSTFCLL